MIPGEITCVIAAVITADGDTVIVTPDLEELTVRETLGPGKRAAETGRFTGTWRKPDGIMHKTGIYLAMCLLSAGTWRLKSKAFVTLACTGSTACEQVN